MSNLPPSAPATDQVETTSILRVVLRVSGQRFGDDAINLVERHCGASSVLVIAGGSFTSVMVMTTMTVSLLVHRQHWLHRGHARDRVCGI